MAVVAVVTDSTASLSPEQALLARVKVIPLQVVIDQVSLAEADDAVTPAVVARALREGRQVTTSRPTPEAFAATFATLAGQGFEAIVSAHLSRELSGTYEAAALAAGSAPVPVSVVDTATLGMATGFAVLSGAAAALSEAAAHEVAAIIGRRSAMTSTYFYVDSLEYLRRGGRIGAATALLGSALSVKPLLTVTSGQIRPLERVRTASKAVTRLQELGVAAAARATRKGHQVDVAVHHLDSPEGAAGLVAGLRSRLGGTGEITVSEVSAVLGVHVGPGTLGVVVAPRV